MNSIYPYERRVFYYETDKMGIMHHSNYIRILEETRISLLSQAGMPFEKIEAAGVLVPVLSAGCRYKTPLVFDEPFAVYPVITFFNGVRFSLEYKIVSRRSGAVCAEGESSHCFTDTGLRPIRTKNSHPDIYKIFRDYTGYIVRDREDREPISQDTV